MSPRKSKIDNYKGFSIESVLGGYVIALYCRKHVFYLSGPVGGTVSEKADDARRFRAIDGCQKTIDGIVNDHATWVRTLNSRQPVATDNINPNVPF